MSVLKNLYRYDKIILLAFMLVIGVTYTSKFSDNFFDSLDDDWGIYENPLVQDFNKENLLKIWANDTRDMYYLPVTFTSFAIDVALWGNDAKLMKIENLVLFIVSGCLLYYLLSLLGVSPLIMLGTVVLYWVHPMQIESLALPTGRRQVLCVLFLIISAIGVYKYLFGNGKWYWLLLGIFGFALSVGAKPPSLMFLPFVCLVVVLEQYYFKNIKFRFKQIALLLIPLLFIAIVCVYLNIQAGERNALKQEFTYTVLQHILIVLSSFGIIIKKIFFGHYIIFDPIDTPNYFRYMYYVLYSIVTFIVFVAIYIGVKYKNRGVAYGLVWFVMALVPSGILLLFASDFPMNTSDRYFMLASPGILAVLVYVISKTHKVLGGLILFFFAGYLYWASMLQLNHWVDTWTLIGYNVQVKPTKDMMYKLSESYFRQGDFEKSIAILKQSLDLKREEAFPYYYIYIKMAQIAFVGGEKDLAYSFFVKALYTENTTLHHSVKEAEILEVLKQKLSFSLDENENFRQYFSIRDELNVKSAQ